MAQKKLVFIIDKNVNCVLINGVFEVVFSRVIARSLFYENIFYLFVNKAFKKRYCVSMVSMDFSRYL